MFYLVSYDIPDDKRRTKVAKCMLDYAKRVQYSVFECQLEKEQLDELKSRLQKLIDQETDNLRIYSFCQHCYEKIEVYGNVPVYTDEKVYVV